MAVYLWSVGDYEKGIIPQKEGLDNLREQINSQREPNDGDIHVVADSFVTCTKIEGGLPLAKIQESVPVGKLIRKKGFSGPMTKVGELTTETQTTELGNSEKMENIREGIVK